MSPRCGTGPGGGRAADHIRLRPRDISLAWLNQYLSEPVSADEADELLTQAGLPIEERRTTAAGDTVLDVEVTSNRPDCLSHVGCAREVAAMSGPAHGGGRELIPPRAGSPEPAAGGPIEELLTLKNRVHEGCPLFTARVIEGCTIGPSPAWLAERLEAIGQRPINNAVDVTNFITHELGNPCHVFDLDKLAGRALIVRDAQAGEKLRTLDERDRTLDPSDLVVADAERPTSLAGVIGGADSEVSARTTRVVLEMATWDPLRVRATARRLNIQTDAAYRFQRGIDPRTIEPAAARAAELIAELTGGAIARGVLSAGAPLPEPLPIALRPSRVRALMGLDVPAGDQIRLLRELGIEVEQVGDDELRCTVPPWRSRDLTREVDLVEEVARAVGFDRIGVDDTIAVRVAPPQPRRAALTEIGRVLTGLGFDETVTFSFTTPARAELMLTDDLRTVSVDDERRGDEPTLRPSVLAGLLACRKQNQDARAAPAGEVRLFETASAFAQHPGGESAERPTLAALLDAPAPDGDGKRAQIDTQAAVRAARATADTLVRACWGPGACVMAEPFPAAQIQAEQARPSRLWQEGACARIRVGVLGEDQPTVLGTLGLISEEAMAAYDLDHPVAALELELDELVRPYPPAASAAPLPAYPPIERDLSLIVGEPTAWAEIIDLIAGLGLERLVRVEFVGVYRGTQIGTGKKSVTLRLVFRDPDRTLRREEVDPQVEAVARAAGERFGAQQRG